MWFSGVDRNSYFETTLTSMRACVERAKRVSFLSFIIAHSAAPVRASSSSSSLFLPMVDPLCCPIGPNAPPQSAGTGGILSSSLPLPLPLPPRPCLAAILEEKKKHQRTGGMGRAAPHGPFRPRRPTLDEKRRPVSRHAEKAEIWRDPFPHLSQNSGSNLAALVFPRRCRALWMTDEATFP